MTAQFPAAVPTTAGLRGNLVDNLATTLNGALTAGAVTITVADTTDFPSAGLLSIQRADGTGSVELCSYTGKTGTTFTGVTRNFNSRFNQAWASADIVALFWAADHYNHAVEEVIAIAQNIVNRFGLNTALVIPNGITMTFSLAGGGPIVTTPDGAHTYQLGVDNNGNPQTLQIS